MCDKVEVSREEVQLLPYGFNLEEVELIVKPVVLGVSAVLLVKLLILV